MMPKRIGSMQRGPWRSLRLALNTEMGQLRDRLHRQQIPTRTIGQKRRMAPMHRVGPRRAVNYQYRLSGLVNSKAIVFPPAPSSRI